MYSQKVYYCTYCGNVLIIEDTITYERSQSIVCNLCGFSNDIRDLKVFKNLIMHDIGKQADSEIEGYNTSYSEIARDSSTSEIEIVLKKLFNQRFLERAYNDLIKLLLIIKLQYSTPYFYTEPSIPENADLPEYIEHLLHYASLTSSMSNVIRESKAEIRSTFLLISSFVQLIKGYAEIAGAVSDYFWIETARFISFGKNYRFYPGFVHLIDEINQDPDKRKILLERLALQRFRIVKNFAIEGINLGFHQDLFQILLKLAESAEIYIKFLIKSYEGDINKEMLNDSISKLKEAIEIIDKSSDSSIFRNFREQISQSILNLQTFQNRISDTYDGLKTYVLHTEHLIKRYLIDLKTKRIIMVSKALALFIIILGILALAYDTLSPQTSFLLSIYFGSFVISLPIIIMLRDIILILLVWRSLKFINQIIKRAQTDIQKISKEFSLIKNTFGEFKVNQVSPMVLWNEHIISLFTNNFELLMSNFDKILRVPPSNHRRAWRELSMLVKNSMGGSVSE